jgi:hypothetical protein
VAESDALDSQSSANALHDVLYDVMHARVQTLAQAWSKILDAQWGSFEFAQRHGEVVCLWSDTVSQINALEYERTRKRMLVYANSWWSALITPSMQWDSVSDVARIISQSDLDQLANLSDLISAQLGGSATAPAGKDLAALRAECEEWMSLLGDSEEITDESFRRTLQAQVSHLLWLIDNANLFGVSRVVQHGDQLTGALIRSSRAQEGKIRNPEKFKRQIIKLVAALALVAGVVRNSDTLTGAAEHSVPAIEKVIHEITSGRSLDKNSESGPHK